MKTSYLNPGELTAFFRNHQDSLYKDTAYRAYLLQSEEQQGFEAMPGITEKHLFDTNFDQYIEEAELTLSLIASAPELQTHTLLEIGSGLGFVYAYLKHCGINIVGTEPALVGFEDNYRAACRMCEILSIDAESLYPYRIDECSQLGRNFDIIFSNNVIEHVHTIDRDLYILRDMLTKNGWMVHHTVNYVIPYDPHFKMLLVPFFPRLTERFAPSLRTFTLWRGLNFITAFRLRRLATRGGLTIVFTPSLLADALVRLDTDPIFRTRHSSLVPLYRIAKRLGLVSVLRRLPAELVTPMRVTMYPKKEL